MNELIEIRHLQTADYEAVKAAMLQAYPRMGTYWGQEQLARLVSIFPEGQFVVTVNGEVVAAALALIIDHAKLADQHTFREVTGDYTFSTHDPAADTLYGIEVFVVPAMRGRRLARRLYDARKELCERLNLRAIAFGARIAGYHEYQDTLSPKEYVRRVKDREIVDPALNFQLANDFHPVRVLRSYLPGDEDSGDYALLMEWDNMLYDVRPAPAIAQKTQVRLGLVQWQMRLYDGPGGPISAGRVLRGCAGGLPRRLCAVSRAVSRPADGRDQ